MLPFFSKYGPKATWYDQLRPLSKDDEPFFISPEEVKTTTLTVHDEPVSIDDRPAIKN